MIYYPWCSIKWQLAQRMIHLSTSFTNSSIGVAEAISLIDKLYFLFCKWWKSNADIFLLYPHLLHLQSKISNNCFLLSYSFCFCIWYDCATGLLLCNSLWQFSHSKIHWRLRWKRLPLFLITAPRKFQFICKPNYMNCMQKAGRLLILSLRQAREITHCICTLLS